MKLRYWICPQCAMLNDEKQYYCRNCQTPLFPFIFSVNWLQFETVEALKKRVKLMREKMGAKVWWSP